MSSPLTHPMIESAPTQPLPPQQHDVESLFPRLPCRLSLEIPAIRFTVGDLLRLKPGSIVETIYHQSSDLPLHVNGQLVGWTEFEVVGERLAVRPQAEQAPSSGTLFISTTAPACKLPDSTPDKNPDRHTA